MHTSCALGMLAKCSIAGSRHSCVSDASHSREMRGGAEAAMVNVMSDQTLVWASGFHIH